ncbi:MAG: GTP 3',8-cyclase MoaA [Selenomonadaceae bacterium]|nr:GTP 3',8-cyclase MoaA [Selenomonadaceae bacterium]
MIDQFGRRIEYARISVTDRCNLRCRYCMPECGVEKISHADILTFEEILRVVKIFSRLGIKKIRLTGGEPLLRKNLPALIRDIKKIGSVEIVTLTTNGVLLEKFAADLIAAEIDGINLSLDTFDEKIFTSLTRRKLFENVMRGLKILIGKKNVKLNCVPLRGVNEGDILKLVELARENFIDVRFIELMPIGCAVDSKLQGIPTAEIFALIESHCGKLYPAEKNFLQGPAEYFRAENFVGRIGFIDALEHKFCATCNRIRLTAEGFLKPCLNFGIGLDVKNLLRSNVGDEKILQAIEQTIFKKPREHFFNRVNELRDGRLMNQVGG